MRHYHSLALLAFIALIFKSPAFGEQVSPNTAAKVAANYASRTLAGLQQRPGQPSFPRVPSAISVVEVPLLDGARAAYLVGLDDDRLVVCSADTDLTPVLCVVGAGSKSLAPSQMAPLLDIVRSDVRARVNAQQAGAGPSIQNANLWQSLSGGANKLTRYPSDPKGLLTFTDWNQGPPWNDMCPLIEVDGQTAPVRAFVGCVATAFAQVLQYWKSPSRYANFHEYRTDTRGIWFPGDAASLGFPTFPALEAGLSNVAYDGSSTELSRLSLAAGIMVEMDYGIRGPAGELTALSGAWVTRIQRALKEDCGYTSALSHSDGWNAQLKQRIINNIKKGWPVIIAIRGESAQGHQVGHAIIVEGYDDVQDTFLFNFGWGSNLTVWYSLPAFEHGYTWNNVEEAVTDISPYGWSQPGSDSKNTHLSQFDAPTSEPVPAAISQSCSSQHVFKGLTQGSSGKIYATVSPTSIGKTTLCEFWVMSEGGEVLKNVSLPNENRSISPPCQIPGSSKVFLGTGIGNIYYYDTVAQTVVLSTSDPLRRFQLNPKTGDTDYVVFLGTRINVSNPDVIKCLTKDGVLKWTYSIPVAKRMYSSRIAIDQPNRRLYVTYWDESARINYLACINLDTGTLTSELAFPDIVTSLGASGGAPSINKNGEVFVGCYTKLYKVTFSSGRLSIASSRDFYPAYISTAPIIGFDGTIYMPAWSPNVGVTYKVYALNPNLSDKWSANIQAGGTGDSVSQGFAFYDGTVIFRHTKDLGDNGTSTLLYAFKDAGGSAQPLWSKDLGSTDGQIVPGAGYRLYFYKDSLQAWSSGERGNPEEGGMGFTADVRPSLPSNPNPANGGILLTRTAQLSWTCSHPQGHSLSYDIYISSPGSEVLKPLVIGTPQSSVAVTNLAPGTMYTWKVVATDGQTFIDGPKFKFNTAQAPGAFSLVTPAPDEVLVTLNPAFSWSSGLGATGYRIQMTADSNGSPGPVPFKDKPLNNIHAWTYDGNPALTYGATFWWRVVATNQVGESVNTGSWRKFTLQSPVPTPPTGVSASDGTYPDRVRVTWTVPSGATTCEVWRHTSLNLTNASKVLDATGTVFEDTDVAVGNVYYYWVRARNAGGISEFSVPDSGYVQRQASATAVFVAEDRTTKGNWKGVYGGTGYVIAGDATNFPSYASAALQGQRLYADWPWRSLTWERRSLQRATSGNERIAACWYSETNFSMALNVGAPAKRLALYFLDYDSYQGGRRQEIEIVDFATGLSLDRRELNDFSQGKYLVWDISGHVRVDFRKTAANAVLNGIFFGPPGGAAVYVRHDSTTRGDWRGTYGDEGCLIIGDSGNIPDPVLAPGNHNYFSWADATTDRRALQRLSGGAERAAACWSSDTSFHFDIATGTAGPRRLGVYFLDWDLLGRAMDVQVTDVRNSAVLSKQSVSNFEKGKYMQWDVLGNVRMTVTGLTGNAVISGVFLDEAEPCITDCQRLPNGDLYLKLAGGSSPAHRLEASHNLRDWLGITTNWTSGGVVEFVIPNVDTGSSFYRTVAQP